jgi:aspartyl protease family protein
MSGIGELAKTEPLLLLAIIAVVAAAAGWMIERDRPRLAKALRQSAYLGMLAAGLLLVGQIATNTRRSDAALLLNAVPKASVVGGETVVPLAADGHFWIRAEIDGQAHRFLVDTGATYTALSGRSAAALNVAADTRMPVELGTANGPIIVHWGKVREVRIGSITTRDLDVVIGGYDGPDVLGMNFLSRLAAWRVEGDKLVLVPRG